MSAHLRRQAMRARRPVPERIQRMLEQSCREVTVKRKVRVVVQSALSVPLVIGALRPLLVLPEDIGRQSSAHVRHVLLHELTHIHRGDLLVIALLNVLRAVYWFNPFTWLCFKLVRADMETACDARVISRIGVQARTDYISTVLRFTEHGKARRLTAAMGMADGRMTMENRIRGMFRRTRTGLRARAAALMLVLLLLAAGGMTACQPTPEMPPVVQRDKFENLIGNTSQPTAEQTPENRIKLEDEYIKKYESGNSSKIKVTVDAAINASKSTGSILLVEPDNYDLDFAKRAFDYFIGDEYYNDVYTKDDFMLMMLPLQQAIQSMEDDSVSKGNAESQLGFYQHRYVSAPESNERGEIAFNDAKTKYIGLKGYPYDGAVSELYIGNGGMGNTAFYYMVQDGTKEYKASNYAYSGKPARNMEKSYDEAMSIAVEALNKLYEDDMSLMQTDIYNIFPIDATYGSAIEGRLDNTCGQCYMFTFTPVYGGLPQLYAPEAKNLDDMTDEGVALYEQKWDYAYNMQWPAQYVQVLVDDSGIVQFWGFSPTRVTQTVNENVAMQPFDQILEKFKRDIFYCSVWSDIGLAEVKINIDRIVFGMIRVPVKDDPDTYFMIPAWQFIGSKEEIPNPLSPEVKEILEAEGVDVSNVTPGYSESGKTFLVLNALDGSIIDTSYYINVRGTLEETIGVNKNLKN